MIYKLLVFIVIKNHPLYIENIEITYIGNNDNVTQFNQHNIMTYSLKQI